MLVKWEIAFCGMLPTRIANTVVSRWHLLSRNVLASQGRTAGSIEQAEWGRREGRETLRGNLQIVDLQCKEC